MSPAAVAERRFSTWFWPLLVTMPVIFFATMYLIDGRQLVDAQWWFEKAEGVLANQDVPPDSTAAWHEVPIPRVFKGTPEGSSAWWRFPLPAAVQQPLTEWMVIVPFPQRTNFSLWVDDRPIGSRGNPDEQTMLRHPVLFWVQNPADGPAPASVFVRSQTPRPLFHMSSVLIGPKEALLPYAQYLQGVQRSAIQAIMAMMAALAGITGSVLLLRGGRDPVYGWYALLLLMWTLHLSHSQIESPVFGSVDFWTIVSNITLGWFVIAAALFVDRLLDRRHPRQDLLLFSWALLGPFVYLLLHAMRLDDTAFTVRFWVPSIIAIGLLILFRIGQDLKRGPTLENQSLLVLAFFLVAVGIRDYLYNNLTVIDGNILYLPYAAGIGLIVFSAILIRRFVTALDTAERLNLELENRVAEKARALETQYARTRQLEREQVLAKERERLLQEMHDGLGGHIVHALATAEQDDALQPMVPSLKLALEDLRLIIDSIDPEEGAFGAVFSSLRARFAHTAGAVGLRFTWQIAPALESIALNPHQVLTLARIVQEAVTNVIKHADASELSIIGEYEPVANRLRFTISDNGIGLGPLDNGGRGLTSMRSRAAELGGELAVLDGDPGTRVLFTWHPSLTDYPDHQFR